MEEEEEPAKWAPWAPGLELLPGLLLLPGRLLLLLLLLLLGLLLLKALPKSPTPPHLGTSGASTSMADESGMMAEPACVCVLMCVHACVHRESRFYLFHGAGSATKQNSRHTIKLTQYNSSVLRKNAVG